MLEGAKSIGAGAATIALAGAAVGIGNVFSSLIHSVARNPSLAKQLLGYAYGTFYTTHKLVHSPLFLPVLGILLGLVFSQQVWEPQMTYCSDGNEGSVAHSVATNPREGSATGSESPPLTSFYPPRQPPLDLNRSPMDLRSPHVPTADSPPYCFDPDSSKWLTKLAGERATSTSPPVSPAPGPSLAAEQPSSGGGCWNKIKSCFHETKSVAGGAWDQSTSRK